MYCTRLGVSCFRFKKSTNGRDTNSGRKREGERETAQELTLLGTADTWSTQVNTATPYTRVTNFYDLLSLEIMT